MNTKSVLLSNLLLVLWACIMPVKAQHSFAFSYGGSNDERIQGMRELSNHTYILYGASYDNGVDLGSNYIGCINGSGKFIWQHYATNALGYANYGALDLGNSVLLGGEYELQSERNAGIALMDYDGKLLIDSIYKVEQGGSGSMIDLLLSEDKQSFTSIGIGAASMGVSSLMLQQTSINGKRIHYRYINTPSYFRYKRSFRHKERETYLVFGATSFIKLDSLGRQIGKEMMVVDANKHQELFDVIQLDTGFVGILYEPFYNSYLQFYNQDGEMTTRVKLPVFSADGGYAVLNKTKEGGLVLLGTTLLVLDAQLSTRFHTKFWEGDYYEWRSVAQAADGGFYGCALDNHKNDASDYDIFVFKTLPDGSVRTGITELPGKQDMQVYPNPASQYLHLPEAAYGAEVRVIDVTGKEVLQQSAMTCTQLDVSSLASGYYTLQLTTRTHRYAQKIAVVRQAVVAESAEVFLFYCLFMLFLQCAAGKAAFFFTADCFAALIKTVWQIHCTSFCAVAMKWQG